MDAIYLITDSEADESLDALFEDKRIRRLNEMIWCHLIDMTPNDLKSLPYLISRYRAGDTDAALTGPLVYIGAGISSVWQDGYIAGKKAALTQVK